MLCLTKGLGAPVGSVLAASAARIDEARRVRKMLGGAWRQAGVIAAAGLVALEESPPRLADDHRRARLLAAGLAAIPGLEIDPQAVETNILIVGVAPSFTGAEALARALAAGDPPVRVLAVASDTLRLLTHRDLDDEAIETALKAFLDLARRAGAVH